VKVLAINSGALAAALLLISLPVAAAGAGSASSSSGAYVGARLGHGWLDTTARSGADEQAYDAEGIFAGIVAGYDQTMHGPWVIGAVIDFSTGNERGTLTQSGPVIFKIEQQWEATLRGRVGYALEGFTPYATGGLTYGAFQTQYSQVGLPFAVRDTAELGWTIGAGIEVPVDQRLSLVAEYRYSDYGDDVNAFGTVDGPYEVSSNKVHLGLNFGF
jgi:outer membrane immunogenic protein